MKTRHSTHENTIIFPWFVHKNKEKHDVFAKGGGGEGEYDNYTTPVSMVRKWDVWYVHTFRNIRIQNTTDSVPVNVLLWRWCTADELHGDSEV